MQANGIDGITMLHRLNSRCFSIDVCFVVIIGTSIASPMGTPCRRGNYQMAYKEFLVLVFVLQYEERPSLRSCGPYMINSLCDCFVIWAT